MMNNSGNLFVLGAFWLALTSAWLSTLASGKGLELKNTPLHMLNKKNFMTRVLSARDKSMFLVLFVHPNKPLQYADKEGVDKSVAPKTVKAMVEDLLTPVAEELYGVVPVGAVDCQANAGLCKEQGITANPQLVLYQINPLPPKVYDSAFNVKHLTLWLKHSFPHHLVTELKKENLESFRSTKPSMPKCIAFSQNEQCPSLILGLSVVFKDRIKFGFVNVTKNEQIKNQFGVDSVPQILMLGGGSTQRQWFPGSKFNFEELIKWLNPMAETFILDGGRGDKTAAGGANRPSWADETVPELTENSANSLCLGKSSGNKSVCAVFITEDESLKSEERLMLEELSRTLAETDDKPVRVRWNFLSLKKYPGFKSIFKSAEYPNFMLLKGVPKVRYSMRPTETPLNKKSILNFLESFMQNNGKFVVVKNMPKFEDTKASKDEL